MYFLKLEFQNVRRTWLFEEFIGNRIYQIGDIEGAVRYFS